MSIFKKIEDKKEETKLVDNDLATTAVKIGAIALELAKAPEDNWMWVDAYKGMDKNMQGHGNFQYEIGKQYDMPKENVKVCESGFHCCLKLSDVFSYFKIGNNNRFFKVKALVKQSDYAKCLKSPPLSWCSSPWGPVFDGNKLAAASIIIESELSIDEILRESSARDLPERYKKIAIEVSCEEARREYETDTLIEEGYAEAISQIIVNKQKFTLAHALAQQKELSMDVKIAVIFTSN